MPDWQNDFEKIYRQSRKSLVKYVSTKVSDIMDAEDIVESAFLDMLNKCQKEKINHPYLLIKIIINRKLCKYYKYKSRIIENNCHYNDEVMFNEAPDLEDKIAIARTIERINSMPEMQKEMMFKLMLGISALQLALEDGNCHKTIYKRISNARNDLKNG
jgi:DNA-directed RNA polymerase specialized sigma24 family protein